MYNALRIFAIIMDRKSRIGSSQDLQADSHIFRTNKRVSNFVEQFPAPPPLLWKLIESLKLSGYLARFSEKDFALLALKKLLYMISLVCQSNQSANYTVSGEFDWK